MTLLEARVEEGLFLGFRRRRGMCFWAVFMFSIVGICVLYSPRRLNLLLPAVGIGLDVFRLVTDI